MEFESFADFIVMGGHGIYVWPAFVMTIALLMLLLWKPFWEQRQLLKLLHQQMTREKNKIPSGEA